MRALDCDRWTAVTELIGPSPGSVLDIGCRDKVLRQHLPADTRYVGFDLFPPADVIGSAEEPLPFGDDEFEVVVMADVLEHLNDPHSALDEALRVASRAVVIVLPNLYSLMHRIRFAAGLPGGKYEFGPERKLDRHRWLMNVDQAAAFAHGRAQAAGWTVAEEAGWTGGFRRLAARAAYGAARAARRPNLWVWAYAARLEPGARRSSNGAAAGSS
jgi:SAM-dependent methyltransferase